VQLKPFRIRFEPVPEGQEAIDPNALGLRSKAGGAPDWDQTNETPTCPDCNKLMTFVAQLDSFQHDSPENANRVSCTSKAQEFMFGDVGLFYLFFCFECLQSRVVFQCG
jgi:hypothetical protein